MAASAKYNGHIDAYNLPKTQSQACISDINPTYRIPFYTVYLDKYKNKYKQNIKILDLI